MLNTLRDWFGFGDFDTAQGHSHGAHSHGRGDEGHGHTHGVIDPSIASTERGVWAIKWSFVILAITAVLQLFVVYISGSVALLADTIHNIGDATTAIPLWIAFALTRRKPSKTFTYGLGRTEDLAGILIVLIILFSALVAGYEAIDRLINPKPVVELGWLTAAGIIGFLGNEAVAVFRIRIGREMNSAALIADGYHARTDGLTSLAVVFGALGVWLGFPLADPIIGLLITIAIFGIVWQSARAVLTRMLDGVEPGVINEIRHAAEHVRGIERVTDVKARWLGHALHADIRIAVDEHVTLNEAQKVSIALEQELRAHLPALAAANVVFANDLHESVAAPNGGHGHHHAPEPFRVASDLGEGLLEIVDTAQGERMRLTLSRPVPDLKATVTITRSNGPEVLALRPTTGSVLESEVAPAEPHEFAAELHLANGQHEVTLLFRMEEPEGHHH